MIAHPGRDLDRRLSGLVALWLVLAALHISFHAPVAATLVVGAVELGAAAYAALRVAARWRTARSSRQVVAIEGLSVASLLLFLYAKGRLLLEIALVVEGDAEAGLDATNAVYSALLGASAVPALLVRSQLATGLAAASVSSPARVMVTSFTSAILVGTGLLSLPVSVVHLHEVSLLDALFTATSAVCVTGLAVNDVAVAYSRFGHVVILGLIQAGGLGIMTLGTTAAVFAGRRLRVQTAASLTEMLDADSLASMKRLVRRIVLTTAVFELVGAAALFASLQREVPEPGERAFQAVFHAVSAFCNAGFSILPGGLSAHAEHLAPLSVIGTLVVVGGLGFPVLDELGRTALDRLRRRPRRRVSLHTRIVLAMSGALVVGGAVPLLMLEWRASMAHLTPAARVASALFHAVSARTAGFSAVDVGAMLPGSLMLIMGLMFVGASPASTGGGIKTTTLAVFVASLRALVRGRPRAEVSGRTLPELVLSRALAVTVVAAGVVMTAAFALVLVDGHDPLDLMFEACSAFSTSGLSSGITPSLAPAAKLVLVVVMLIGRVGPLTVALALGEAAPPRPIAYPEERVLVG